MLLVLEHPPQRTSSGVLARPPHAHKAMQQQQQEGGQEEENLPHLSNTWEMGTRGGGAGIMNIHDGAHQRVSQRNALLQCQKDQARLVEWEEGEERKLTRR